MGERSGDDHLGLFDDPDEEPQTGEVDLAELREALTRRGESGDDVGTGGAGGARDARPRAAQRREHRARERRRRSRRIRSTIVAVVVMLLIASGVVVGIAVLRHRDTGPTDWAGTGSTVVVVRVQSGDGLSDVAQTLVDAGVVANAATFVQVASGDARMKALQPGFYAVHEHSSAQSVVAELTNPASRVGHMRVIPGQTLADITKVSTSGQTSTKPGILTRIAEACVPTNGAKSCFSMDDLWQAEETASLGTLGVVGWAMTAVQHAPDPRRRLEGLILPGDYDIEPGSTAVQALSSVIQASAAQWNTTGIVAAAKSQHITPYEQVIVASLVQSEGLAPDMPKIARVVYNRLADGTMLKFDSTVNYALNRAQIATTAADRANPSPYNTYAHVGLPPTPIGAPGPDALDAAGDPATGTWLYFVAVDKDGTTCFSTTAEQHEACVAKARANGVFG